jgi:flagellar hook-associated protein 3 FlgL
VTISTLHLMRASYLSIAANQERLADAQVELSTGKIANIGPALGRKVSTDLDLRAASERTALEINLNGIAAAEMTAKQQGLSAILDIAHGFTATLVGARNAQNGQETIKAAAENALKSLFHIANSTHNGKAIFAGLNSTTAPLADYLSPNPVASKSAIDSAFLNEFGFPQNSPSVSTITPSHMDSFLNGSFASQFTPGQWQANWSSADSQDCSIRISDNFLVQPACNTNDSAFRNLTMALTMAFDLGAGSLGQGTFEKIADKAASVAASAASQFANMGSQLGITQKLLRDESDKLSLRADVITQHIGHMEDVDQFEVSTRINTLTTQLEASYSLTARINKLTLLNYL